MDLRLKDKIALVTGGSRGIGRAAALTFADEGCHVAICARSEEPLRRTEAELRERGVRVTAVRADVTDSDQAAQVVEQTVAELGGLDILVNNVYSIAGGERLGELTDADWRATYEGCLFQAMRLIRLATPHLSRREGAAIVNVTSLSGWAPQLSAHVPYGSAKAALIYLTECIALELVGARVRVNAVSPGSVYHEGGPWDRIEPRHPGATQALIDASLPAGRMGAPEEIADAIVFLASPRAGWINGRHLPVDGLQQPTATGWLRPW